MLFTIIVVLFTIFFSTRYVLRRQKFKGFESLPGPKPIPMLGNALEFGTNIVDTLKNQVRLFKEYGTILRVWIGRRPTLMIADPEKIKFFLTSNKHTSKSPGYDFAKEWLGNGLLTSKGELWRKHRKLITPAFHFNTVEKLCGYLGQNLRVLITILGKGVGNKSFNIQQIISLYSLDVMCETAMSTKVNAQINSDAEFVQAVQGFFEIALLRFFSFYKQYDFLFMLTPDYWQSAKYLNTLNTYSSNVLQERKRNRFAEQQEHKIEGGKGKTAFLDLLLTLQSEQNALTDEEIKDEVNTFLFAGNDTLTSTITFCLLTLADFPEIQKQLVAESNEIIGTDRNADVTYRHVQDMRYLDLVIKESMRFNPPVPFIERDLEEDVQFEDILLPKGTTIQIVPYVTHRSEEHYKDADKFIPERFLPEECAGRHPFAYIPFSAGPRNCIGQRFANIVLKCTVIQVLRNFEVLPAEPKFTAIHTSKAVLGSANGICVQLKVRQ